MNRIIINCKECRKMGMICVATMLQSTAYRPSIDQPIKKPPDTKLSPKMKKARYRTVVDRLS